MTAIQHATPAQIETHNAHKARLARMSKVVAPPFVRSRVYIFRVDTTFAPAPLPAESLEWAFEKQVRKANDAIKPIGQAASIIGALTGHHNIAFCDITSHRRTISVAYIRAQAAFCVWTLCPIYSLPRIGRLFDKDHTTILHSKNKIGREHGLPDGFTRLQAEPVARSILAAAGYVIPEAE